VAEAALWGFFGGAALIVGALIAVLPRRPIPDHVVAYIMAFGAGVLVSAVSYDLTAEAIEIGGGDSTALGLATGALAFFGGDYVLRRRNGGASDDEDPQGIVLGALLDGIPESAALGMTLLGGTGVSVSFVAAVFISNLPESISASAEMKPMRSRRWILMLWLGIAVVSGLAAAVGYQALGDASGDTLAFVNAFAAGAILCMLADTMFPQAYAKADMSLGVGLVTVLGFALAALLATA
jgi:ZIP family zinc transporter